jgi:hypothetical protein
MERVLLPAVGSVYFNKLLTVACTGVFGVLTTTTLAVSAEVAPKYQCAIASPSIPLELLTSPPAPDPSSARSVVGSLGVEPVRGFGVIDDRSWFLVGDPLDRSGLSYVAVSLSTFAVVDRGLCLLRTVDSTGRVSASVALASKPNRSSRLIDVWVKSFTCGEGGGRVSIDKVEDRKTVRLTVFFIEEPLPKGVTPTCLDSPARRYRVTLTNKLGTRSVFDSTKYPHRAMQVLNQNGPWVP